MPHASMEAYNESLFRRGHRSFDLILRIFEPLACGWGIFRYKYIILPNSLIHKMNKTLMVQKIGEENAAFRNRSKTRK